MSRWSELKQAAEAAVQHLGRRGPEEDLPAFAERYDRVFRSLTREELYGDASYLDEDDLIAGLFDRRQRDHRFLSFYTEGGAAFAFERYGFFDLLRAKGFDPVVSAELSNPDDHKLRIHDREQTPEHLLIELAVGFRDIALGDDLFCHVLFINWLLMQDPRATLESATRPPLPGQEHPGLGLFPHFGYLLRLMALRLGCDGLLNHPAHFHNGHLYGRFFHFVDPDVEGRFRALDRDLKDMPLAEATRAVGEGRVIDQRGAVCTWLPVDQAAPLTEGMRAWFESRAYQERVAEIRDGLRFTVREG